MSNGKFRGYNNIPKSREWLVFLIDCALHTHFIIHSYCFVQRLFAKIVCHLYAHHPCVNFRPQYKMKQIEVNTPCAYITSWMLLTVNTHICCCTCLPVKRLLLSECVCTNEAHILTVILNIKCHCVPRFLTQLLHVYCAFLLFPAHAVERVFSVPCIAECRAFRMSIQ